ncbi:MAG: hypothetical protein HQ536_04155 [Parcubacteria group bacterium]|nr:hypothetical protein [Parcubacteria group bacterium]
MKQLQPFNFSITIFTFAAFLITEGLAIFGATRMRQLFESGVMEAPQRAGFDFFQMIMVFFVGTFVLLAFLRMSRGKVFFDVLFSLAVFFGVWVIFGTFLPNSLAILFASAILLLRYFYPSPFTQNLAIILGIAGLSIGLGMALSVMEVLILLVVLSFYDIIAVFVTKHMVRMFKGLLKRGVIMALMIPFEAGDLFIPLRATTRRVEKLKSKFARHRKSSSRVSAGGYKFMFLGTGDLALPTVFIISALPQGWAPTIGAVVGSLIGLYLTQTIFFTGRKKPIPALPPIATGTILGYAIGLLLI